MKYKCSVCGWEYDGSEGLPRMEVSLRERRGARFRMILNARYAA